MANENQQDQDNQKKDGDGNRQPDAEARKKNDPKRKRTIRFVVLALIVVAAIAAIPIYAYYSVRESTDDAQVDGHLVPISPRINGRIISVLVNDNQPVRAGQELVTLDPSDYQVALEQAQAQLATAEANTTESKVNVPLTDINTRSSVSTSTTQADQNVAAVRGAEQAVGAARGNLDSAKAALAEAQANQVKAQRDLVRYKDLVDKDEISKQEYDAALASADANTAQVQSAQSDIIAAQHTLDQSIAEVDQAKARLATALVQRRQSEQLRPKQAAVSEARYKQALAQIKQSQAALDQAKLNLGYTHILAPVDGVVSRKSAEPGMQLSPGQQIMALIPLDDVWVTANFKETQLRQMHVGQHVSVEVDTFGSSRQYRGHVDSIAGASGARFSLLPPENATGNYVKVVQRIPVKIVLEPGENRDHRLLPGMSVQPTVFIDTDKEHQTSEWQ
jgi:membrane fusion protein (multidrug efflux system)